MEKLYEILIKNPHLTIEIGGHTDSKGLRANNLILSENRAKAVYDYLIKKGIAADRLTTKGYADYKPFKTNTNKTELERAENRRTEFTITGNK